ncbi:MAG: ExeM/NucH family extracellular endonuclease, partial [Chloroflexota bacterium]|nr:ExeM/NucH family extracellular endonuclease [Chloroflexota bacterium]
NQPYDLCGPSGGMDCRGADYVAELVRQRTKILSALVKIDADIVGLMEIENDRAGEPPDYAVADLVAGLNDVMGPGTYDYIATGAIGLDAIKVAMIYKPGNVTPVGDFAILDDSVDPFFFESKNRPVLAQSFMDNIVGDAVTVAVNHLKSKGSPCDDLGDPDLFDGQGNCNLTRSSAAQAEVDWLASDPTETGVENLLIIGDLNAYDKEDPVDAIKAGSDDTPGTSDDYFDMIYEILGEAAYSYLYDGKVGYLDYALANTALVEYVADVTIWHINADEADLINYDMSYKKDAQDAIYAPDAYRASDHDPVIITLTFNKPPLAEDDVYETDQDVTLIVPADGVLWNDGDLNENDKITLDVVVEPLHGTVELNNDGSFTYIPDLLYFGEDSFVYLMMANPPERGEFSDTATVYITIDSKYKYYLPVGYGD